jgi:SH3-like domain-containing protein
MKLALLLTVLVIPVLAAPALAQAPAAGAASSKKYTGTVTADNVYIRCGPSASSAYPFGKLSMGDVLEVVDEGYGWATVRTNGPAFKNIYGYVLAGDKVALSADGQTLTVNADTDVRAPNIGADGNPDASFKSIGKVSAGTTLKVAATLNGEREKVYKVSIPGTCQGFVNLNFVRRASAGETGKLAANDAPSNGAAAPDGNSAAPANGAGGTTPPAVIEEKPKVENVPKAANPTDAAKPGADQGAPAGTVTTNPPADEKKAEPAPTAPPAPVKSPQQLASEKRRQTFKDLEVIWVTVKAEPLASSEVGVLRDRYMMLQNDPECEAEIKRLVATRVQQLEVQIEAQQKIRQLKEMRAALDADVDTVRNMKIALEARSDYTVVGILNASSIYDGKRLPLLYRLVDPGVGQTVAYVSTKNPAQLATMLGTLVGLRGEKRYDEALRVSVIEPTAIEILTTSKSGRGGASVQ